MAGNSNSGRPRKPTNELKLHGGYRADRHGERDAEPKPEGLPTMAEWLTDDGVAVWNRLVPGLIKTKVATSADSETLAIMCDCWSIYLKAREKYHDNITDKDSRAAWRSALQEFNSLASRFGLTPADRARLHVETDSQVPTLPARKRG